jgi:hypothetical protein
VSSTLDHPTTGQRLLVGGRPSSSLPHSLWIAVLFTEALTCPISKEPFSSETAICKISGNLTCENALKPHGNTLPSLLKTLSVLSSVSRCGHSNLGFHVPGIQRFWREWTLDSIRAHRTGDLGDDEMSVLLDARTLVELASVTENNVSNLSVLDLAGHTVRGLTLPMVSTC